MIATKSKPKTAKDSKIAELEDYLEFEDFELWQNENDIREVLKHKYSLSVIVSY